MQFLFGLFIKDVGINREKNARSILTNNFSVKLRELIDVHISKVESRE